MTSTSLRGIIPAPRPIPKRNFIKENAKKLNVNRHRVLFKKDLQQQSIQEVIKESSRKDVSAKPIKPLTFIKKPPKSFPKSDSLLSVISGSSTSDFERPCFRCESTISRTRTTSSQTSDPNDELFLKDAVFRTPTPSVIESLRNDLQLFNLQSPVSKKQKKKLRLSLDRLYRRNETGVLNPLDLNHDDRRLSQLKKLEEFHNTHSLKPEILPELAESEHALVTHVVRMAGHRREEFAKARMLENEYEEKLAAENQSISTGKYSDNCKGDGKTSMGSQARGELPATYRKGTIPRYLREIKEKALEVKRIESQIDVNCPPGHIRLSDEERLEALGFANIKFKELVDELNKIPITSETIRVKQRKIEIERELDQLEQSIRIFSRAKVYVKLEGDTLEAN